jgi:hypothetical protein
MVLHKFLFWSGRADNERARLHGSKHPFPGLYMALYIILFGGPDREANLLLQYNLDRFKGHKDLLPTNQYQNELINQDWLIRIQLR